MSAWETFLFILGTLDSFEIKNKTLQFINV